MKNLLLLPFFLIGGFLFSQDELLVSIVVPLRETVQIGDGEITFIDVKQDSRCPENVTCVWAGEVQLALRLKFPKKASKEELLAVAPGKSALLWRDDKAIYKILRVSPYPKTSAKIPKEDYEIVLQVFPKD